MSHVWMRQSHIWIRHVTMNESCLTYECEITGYKNPLPRQTPAYKKGSFAKKAYFGKRDMAIWGGYNTQPLILKPPWSWVQTSTAPYSWVQTSSTPYNWVSSAKGESLLEKNSTKTVTFWALLWSFHQNFRGQNFCGALQGGVES